MAGAQNAARALARVLAVRRYRLLAAGVALGYTILYLIAIENLVYSPAGLLAPAGAPSVQVVPDWWAAMARTRAPYLWEPVAALYVTRHLALFVSLPNLLLGLALGTLVGLNLAAGAYAVAHARACGRSEPAFWRSLGGAVPALFSGMACCVPTAALALGPLAAGLAGALVPIRPWLVPFSAALLVASLVWSLTRVAKDPS